MELNQITTDFRYVGSYINKLEITNDIINIKDSTKKSFAMNINPGKPIKEHEKNIATVEIDIIVEFEEDDKNAKVEMSTIGTFEAPLDIEEEKLKTLICINGATLLYSIARAKIESISSNVFATGKISLPIINIYDYYNNQ